MEKTITLDEFVQMCQEAVDEHKLELQDHGFVCQFSRWSSDLENKFHVCFYLRKHTAISGTSVNPHNAIKEALAKIKIGETITPTATHTENQ